MLRPVLHFGLLRCSWLGQARWHRCTAVSGGLQPVLRCELLPARPYAARKQMRRCRLEPGTLQHGL